METSVFQWFWFPSNFRRLLLIFWRQVGLILSVIIGYPFLTRIKGNQHFMMRWPTFQWFLTQIRLEWKIQWLPWIGFVHMKLFSHTLSGVRKIIVASITFLDFHLLVALAFKMIIRNFFDFFKHFWDSFFDLFDFLPGWNPSCHRIIRERYLRFYIRSIFENWAPIFFRNYDMLGSPIVITQDILSWHFCHSSMFP